MCQKKTHTLAGQLKVTGFWFLLSWWIYSMLVLACDEPMWWWRVPMSKQHDGDVWPRLEACDGLQSHNPQEHFDRVGRGVHGILEHPLHVSSGVCSSTWYLNFLRA
jgi:hypothetical protein